MTSLLIAALVTCPVIIPQQGTAMLTAKYLHEVRQGELYTYQQMIIVPQGEGQIQAEGHPYYVEAILNGKSVGACSYDPAIFIDGFETGTTEKW